ncbi:MAG: hypothetical protein JWM74_5243 [Myxococcaceae bacterium]|nr:hypothetical protein [Myxococcaceae bacterium]
MSHDLGRVCSFLGPCVVCGERDARQLTTTPLAGGEVVTVCGSHELMHRRATAAASSIAEMRAMLGDRREPRERRFEMTDELGAQLADAFTFTSDRRSIRERRRLS